MEAKGSFPFYLPKEQKNKTPKQKTHKVTPCGSGQQVCMEVCGVRSILGYHTERRGGVGLDVLQGFRSEQELVLYSQSWLRGTYVVLLPMKLHGVPQLSQLSLQI